MSKRNEYSPEFREIAVREVVENDRRVVDVAREMNVLPGTLGNWVSRHRERSNDTSDESVTLTERAELVKLRRENQELRTKTEFLGKAAAFFAREYR